MKRAIVVVVGSVLIGLILAGCATTQSGKPTVTFNTTDRVKIQSAIIDEFDKMDFKVVSQNNDSLILEGRRLGYTGSDRMHAILNMISTTADSTIVVIEAYLKQEAGFGRNIYSQDVTYDTTGAEVVRILKRVKTQIESQ